MDLLSLAKSKRYTEVYVGDTAEGLGSVKGAPCELISAVHDDENKGTIMTYKWTGTDGRVQTQDVRIPDGADGKDGELDVHFFEDRIEAISKADWESLTEAEAAGRNFLITDDEFNSNAFDIAYRDSDVGDALDLIQQLDTPIGTIISFMGTIAPELYLTCDGSEYNIEDYLTLATFFEEQFGSKNKFGGDGVTTFAVPDLRGEFLRGTGTNGHENQGNGHAVGGHQDGTEHIAIRYDISNKCFYAFRDDETVAYPGSMKLDKNIISPTAPANTTYGFKTANGSGSVYTQTVANIPVRYTARPTNTSVNFCIKAKYIFE